MGLQPFNENVLWESISELVQDLEPTKREPIDDLFDSLHDIGPTAVYAVPEEDRYTVQRWREYAYTFVLAEGELGPSERKRFREDVTERFELGSEENKRIAQRVKRRFSRRQPLRALRRIHTILLGGKVERLRGSGWKRWVPVYELFKGLNGQLKRRRERGPNYLSDDEWFDLVLSVDLLLEPEDFGWVGRPADSLDWQVLPEGAQLNGNYARGVCNSLEPAWIVGELSLMGGIFVKRDGSEVRVKQCNFIEDSLPDYEQHSYRCQNCGFQTNAKHLSHRSRLFRICTGPETIDDLCSIVTAIKQPVNTAHRVLHLISEVHSFVEIPFVSHRAMNVVKSLESLRTVRHLSEIEREAWKLARSFTRLALSNERPELLLYGQMPEVNVKSRHWIMERRYRRVRALERDLLNAHGRDVFAPDVVERCRRATEEARRAWSFDLRAPLKKLGEYFSEDGKAVSYNTVKRRLIAKIGEAGYAALKAESKNGFDVHEVNRVLAGDLTFSTEKSEQNFLRDKLPAERDKPTAERDKPTAERDK